MSVFYQLLKNTTRLEHVEELDDLFSTVLGNEKKLDMEIWGLKPEHDFPIKFNSTHFNYIGYIGMSKFIGRDDIRYIEFFHENKGCNGIIEPFIDMVINRLSKDKEKDIIVIPRVITAGDSELWTKYLSKYFTDIESGDKFVLKNNISHKKLEWNELTKTLPSKPELEVQHIMSD
jgi:hypothetical protein